MTKFIKLTCGGGDKIWVDVDSITTICEYDLKSNPDIKSVVWLTSGNCWYVRETPEEVFKMIEEVE